ncbi:GNAT family N-acetyltransferase [Halolamina sp. CBA1230]|uniref:GNAT family N-acetyltransferase n=1 Tax=Halolamina sp. CBA1230 TaxID=1853690 RepID=UPI0009A1CA94|nr:GNAT family N-acetyltransferase [Halolamina sp. CBA1230]
MFPETVVTDRLRLVRADADDADALDLYEHWHAGAPNIEETTEYVTWSPYDHPHGVAETLADVADSAEDGEGAMYLLRPREGEDREERRSAGSRAEPGDDEFAGTAGLFVDWDSRVGGLGMWLRKPFWGRGYSGERADALLALAFDRLDLDLVRVSHLPENENSERAITKYVERHGGRRAGRFRNRVAFDDGSVHDTIEYSVSQREWREADGAETAVEFRE